MGMNLESNDLWPDERHLMTKAANMVISVKEHGLSKFAFGDYMGAVGMKGKEAIGGKVHLTNYRLIFKSHGFNRVRGKHSIFIPNIISLPAKTTRLFIETHGQQYEFVMWFKSQFLASAGEVRDSFTQENLDTLRRNVLTYPEAIGDGLKKWMTLEVINQICSGVRSVTSVLEKLSGTEDNTLLEVLELFADVVDEVSEEES